MHEPQTIAHAPGAEIETAPPNDNRLVIKDIQVWHWWFFLRGFDVHYDSEYERTKDAHWPVWQHALDDAVSWAGGWELSNGVKRLVDEPSEQDYPILFARIRRNQVGNLKRSLQARKLLDTTYIRVVWTLDGEASPDDFSRIKDQDWQYLHGQGRLKPPYLGDAVCLLVTIPEADAKTKDEQEAEAENLAKAILTSWCRKPVESVELLEFACGYYATAHDLNEMVWVLMARDKEPAQQQASHILIDLTPSFMLAWIKGQYVREHHAHILREANKIEFQMDKVLKKVEAEPQLLKSLEETSLRITHPLDKLSIQIAKTREYLVTLKVNRDNLRGLLRDPVFKPGQVRMASFFVSPLSQSIQQIEVDLNYKSITRDKAKERLDLNKMRAEIVSQKDSRKITILLGLFAVFGLIQAFDHEITLKWPKMSFWVKLLIFFIVIAILIGHLLDDKDARYQDPSS